SDKVNQDLADLLPNPASHALYTAISVFRLISYDVHLISLSCCKIAPGSTFSARPEMNDSEEQVSVPNALEQLAVARQQKIPEGIYSVCSAHPWVLEAAIEEALDDGSQILIEATSNQVNHHGGYTGMQPQDFRKLFLDIAKRTGLDESRIILGGDHLGPNPWQKRLAADAMAEAERMVQAYVRAGFEKIHL